MPRCPHKNKNMDADKGNNSSSNRGSKPPRARKRHKKKRRKEPASKQQRRERRESSNRHRYQPGWFRWVCSLIVIYSYIGIKLVLYFIAPSLAPAFLSEKFGSFSGPNWLLTNGADTEQKQAQQQQQQQQQYNRTKNVGSISLPTNKTGSQLHRQKIVDDQWWNEYIDDVAVTFQPSNDTSWCQPLTLRQTPGDPRRPNTSYAPRAGRTRHKHGMYFVRNPKTSSSTTIGIAIQIAENLPKRIFLNKTYLTSTAAAAAMTSSSASPSTSTATATETDDTVIPQLCNHFVDHGFHYTQRQEPYFIWTTIRDPAKRTISQYFYDVVTRGKKTPTDSHLKRYLSNSVNFQLNYIGKDSKDFWSHENIVTLIPEQIVQEIREILRRYNFIVLMERMDESLATFSLLFDFVHVEDLIVFSANSVGGYDDGNINGCNKIVSPKISSDVDGFISSAFIKGNYDYFLYQAVNKSLDMTISMIGRRRVDERIEQIRTLRKLVEKQCLHAAIFPCTQVGKQNPGALENCYFDDSGCGHACIQQTIAKYYQGRGRKSYDEEIFS